MADIVRFPFKSLLDAASGLHDDEHLSISASPDTFLPLHRLINECTDTHPLHRFLVIASDEWKLRDALIALLLPEPAVGALERIRELRDQQGLAIESQDFHLAAAIRDEIHAIWAELPNQTGCDLTLTIEHVLTAIRKLGYTGPLP